MNFFIIIVSIKILKFFFFFLEKKAVYVRRCSVPSSSLTALSPSSPSARWFALTEIAKYHFKNLWYHQKIVIVLYIELLFLRSTKVLLSQLVLIQNWSPLTTVIYIRLCVLKGLTAPSISFRICKQKLFTIIINNSLKIIWNKLFTLISLEWIWLVLDNCLEMLYPIFF